MHVPLLSDPARVPAGTSALRRVVWHAAGLVLAALVAWLIILSYRQPDLLLDLANLRLC